MHTPPTSKYSHQVAILCPSKYTKMHIIASDFSKKFPGEHAPGTPLAGSGFAPAFAVCTQLDCCLEISLFYYSESHGLNLTLPKPGRYLISNKSLWPWQHRIVTTIHVFRGSWLKSWSWWGLCGYVIVCGQWPVSHSFSGVGWQAILVSIELWIQWRNAHDHHCQCEDTVYAASLVLSRYNESSDAGKNWRELWKTPPRISSSCLT